MRQMNAVCGLNVCYLLDIQQIWNYSGFTPLHWVILLGECPKILQILLNSKANTNALNNANESPLNIGIEKGDEYHSKLALK